MHDGNITHGMSYHPVYIAWINMKGRCYNTKSTGYLDYGGRGIRVCERWLECFENFRDDMLSTWKARLSLDRANNDGNYTPNNCRWATRKQQQNNQRKRKK